MYKPKILVVEDDKAVLNLIKMTLETNEYKFHIAQNGEQALLDAVSYNPDVFILDLGLPDMDGIEIIERVRGWSSAPIIVVSARSDDNDKVCALDSGADDYLTKPFSIEEFLARLRVAIRRRASQGDFNRNESNIYENGDLEIDYQSGIVYVGEEEIHLTPIEYRLLVLLSKNTGKVLTHNYILKEVWGNVLQSDVPSLRVFMATLRKKLEKYSNYPRMIQTHIGVGYRMISLQNANEKG